MGKIRKKLEQWKLDIFQAKMMAVTDKKVTKEITKFYKLILIAGIFSAIGYMLSAF